MQRGGPAATYVSDVFMAPIGKIYDYSVQVPVMVDSAVRYHLLLGVSVASLQKLLERQHFRTKSTAVPMSDWKVLVSIPVSEIRRVPLEAAAMLAGLMAALLAAGVLAARWLARCAIGPIEHLGLAADELGQGKEPGYQPQGIVEIDSVAQRMRDAGRQIHQAQQELERRVAEAVAATERAQGALLKSQKLEALGRLTGGIAHEFNNLLQTLSTALQLAKLNNRDDTVRGLLQTCKKTVQRAAGLTGQLGSFGRIQEARQETVDACQQLRSARQLMGGALRADIDLQIDCDEPAWPVKVEPLQFDLALLNLAVNARDAMPRGGMLRIEARNISLAQPAGDSALAALPAGDYVRVTVSDTGSGMTPEVLARALDPFYTTKGQGQGTGLGLPQAYAFALQSQGLLLLDSEPGKGTRVDLWLPRAEQAPLPRGRGVVLFVEDDPLVREAVSHALAEAGFEVLTARDGDQAVALLEGGAQPDVVFSDIVMPGSVNGIDLAAIVRRRDPALPVVLATDYTERQPAIPGLRVLAKPYPIERLIDLLARAVTKK